MDKAETLLKEQQLRVSLTVQGSSMWLYNKWQIDQWSLTEPYFASYVVQMVAYLVDSVSIEPWISAIVFPK